MGNAATQMTGVVLETELRETSAEETWLVDGVEPREIEPDDPEALQKLAEVKSEFRVLETRQYEQLYRQCQLLLMVRSLKLYRAARYGSFIEYSEKELAVEGRRAERLSEYARSFTLEQFLVLGPSLAEAGLQLLNATPEEDGPGDLFTMTLRHGTGAGKAFVQSSVRQVRQEIQAVRDEQGGVPHLIPDGLPAITQQLAERVSGARFKLKNFKSKDAVTTGLVIELPDASHEALQSTLARILGALSKPGTKS